MQFIFPAVLTLASTSAAQWLIQEYSGITCTGQRISTITPLGVSDRECRALGSGTTSVLLSLDGGDEAKRFRLHGDDACLDQEFPGGANCK